MGGDDYLYGESGDDTVGASTHWDEGGNDYLDGGSGDDMLQGGSGSDDLNGGTDNDILIGVYDFTAPQNSIQPQYNAGQYEYDTLTGGDGADTFVLGNSVEAFYNNDGFSGYAEITDFNWAEGDKFQVFGSLDDYTTSEFGGGIDIYYQNDLIAWVSNTTDVIPSEDFIFA
jgi:Ca2+-binding RTX toxin-like protein